MFGKKIAEHRINVVVTRQLKDLCVWTKIGKEQR